MSIIRDICWQMVLDANPERSHLNIERRTLKLIEELGELAQSWLAKTSAANGRGKSWDDVREELADCLIVAYDIAQTPLLGSATVKPPSLDWHSTTTVEDFNPRDLHEILYHLASFGKHVTADIREHHLARIHINRVVAFVSAMALKRLPDQADATADRIGANLIAEVTRKLQKWSESRANKTSVTDAYVDLSHDLS